MFTFVSKTVFIKCLGIEYSGLNSLYTNILGVLNIAELGLSTAVGYSLYKPLVDKDTKKINEILLLYKYLYRIIAVIILIIGLIITIFLPHFVNSSINITEIRISFILYLIATVVSYLFTFLNVLPSADQKNYLVVRIQGNFKNIKNVLQLIAVIVFKNYYVWLILEITGNILSYVYTNYKIKKQYTYYEKNTTKNFKTLLKEYKDIIIKIKDLFFHKIGGLVVNQTDNIVISYFCTLTDVGIYGNYMLIYTLLTGCIDQMFMGITASIGNLIVEKNKNEAYKIWQEMHTLIIFVTVIFCFLFYYLANKFITIWVGGEYVLSNIIVFGITLNIMFRIIKAPIDKFKEAFGLFWDKQAPFIESLINLIISVYLASKIGILGVVIGTIVSNIIIIATWKPFMVFKYGFEEKFNKYIIVTFKLMLLAVLSVLISSVIVQNINIFTENNWINLIGQGIVYAIIITLISLICFMCNKLFRDTLKKYLLFFVSIIKKENKV